MPDVALGVTVFKRTEKLRNLLDSITTQPIDVVYVADNGRVESREELYARDYPFELNVLDVEYDSGLGYGRNAIVEELSEDFLVIVDSDNTVPRNVGVLIDQLRAEPALGGVGGILLEQGRLRSNCFDLYEESDLLIKDIHETKDPDIVEGYPLFRFDMIQNVAAYKRQCLEDYVWDPNYTIGWEHTDFFVGHARNTDWVFGVCPSVVFEHYPGGTDAYESDRHSTQRLLESKRYFLDKWGLRQVVRGQVDWINTTYGYRNRARTIADLLKNVYLQLPPTILALGMDFEDYLSQRR